MTGQLQRQTEKPTANKGFAAWSRVCTNFFLLLDIGVPPPDTAQTPGTLSAIIVRVLISNCLQETNRKLVTNRNNITMKNIFKVLIIASIVLTSCNNEESKTEDIEVEQVNPKEEFAKLMKFMRKFDESAQILKAPTNKLIKVRGKKGTIIHINPDDLETESGQPIGKDVQIELKELSNQQQLLRANAQTSSDKQLLVSGGAYFINVTSEGQDVKLKEGKTYSVEFPKLSNDEMSLYYGQRDSIDIMNWKKTDQIFESPKPIMESPKEYKAIIVTEKGRFSDTSIVAMKNYSEKEYQKIEQQTKISNKVYSPVTLNKFGWINCDKLFILNAPRTAVQCTFINKAEEANYIIVYLIFNDINSVMSSTYYSFENKMEDIDINNIPVGQSVRFLAACYQNDKIFATLTDKVKIRENHNQKLSLQAMSESDFDKLMKGIE